MSLRLFVLCFYYETPTDFITGGGVIIQLVPLILALLIHLHFGLRTNIQTYTRGLLETNNKIFQNCFKRKIITTKQNKNNTAKKNYETKIITVFKVQ